MQLAKTLLDAYPHLRALEANFRHISVQGETGQGGAVYVTLTWEGDLTGIELDLSVINPQDKDTLARFRMAGGFNTSRSGAGRRAALRL